MDTLTFDTPARRRDAQTVQVELCGERFEVNRPKDAVLYFASSVVGSDVADADRAMALLQFLDSTLSPLDRKRYFDRIIDREDPVNMAATIDLVAGLLERWNDWPGDDQVDELVIDPTPTPIHGGPVHVVHEDLDLDLTAYPPKDVVSLFVAASVAAGANIGQQAWAVGLFLDAALDPVDGIMVSRRMRMPSDDLDLEHIAEIVQGLLERWQPAGNRRARRNAARGRGTSSRSSNASATSTAAKPTRLPAKTTKTTRRAGGTRDARG